MRFHLLIYIVTVSVTLGEKSMAQEHLSLVTTPIFLQKNKTVISQGSGFYYIHEPNNAKKLYFLVTNYHVLTGYSPQENMTPKGDQISFYLHNDPNNPGEVLQFSLPLFTDDGVPIWLISQTYPDADVAIIPFSSFPFNIVNNIASVTVTGISENWIKEEIKIRPSTTVTLIGYPYGYFDKKNWLPIWKTGSVASEPNIDFEDKPLFVVDVSAFPGMSGSPVFGIFEGSYETLNGGRTITNQRIHTFLGIHASIQMRSEKKYLEEIPFSSKKGLVISESLELAHVWKTKIITEIIDQFDANKYQKDIVNQLYKK